MFLLAAMLLPAWSIADSGPKPPSSDETDVVLLLDASGSMRITDPERMRDDGVKVLFQFLLS